MRRQSLYIYLFSLTIVLFSLLVVQINEPSITGATSLITGAPTYYDGTQNQFAGEGKAITYDKRIRGLVPGKVYTIDVVKIGPQREIPFESFDFMVKDRRREGMFSFRKPTQLPTSANAPPLGQVYSYGIIAVVSTPEAESVAASDLEKTSVTFSVDKRLLQAQGAEASSIKLHYLSSGSWQQLPITKEPETSFEYVFKAQGPVGIYAITYKIEKVEEDIITAPAQQGPVCGNSIPEAGENCATCPADIKCGSGEICQAGICVTPPAQVRQAPVQQVAPPPTIRKPAQSGFPWIWVLIPAIVIVLVLIVMMLFRRPKEEQGFDEFSQQAAPMQPAQPAQPAQPQAPVQQQINEQPAQIEQRKPMQTNGTQSPQIQQIKDYINNVMQKGFKKEQVKSALVSKGWPANLVDQAFQQLGK